MPRPEPSPSPSSRDSGRGRRVRFTVVDRLAGEIVEDTTAARPADRLLRERLKHRPWELSDPEAEFVVRTVHALFRWRLWLKEEAPETRGERARALDARAWREPAFPEEAEARRRAVPAWVSSAVDAPAGWTRALQRPAPAWLRARPGRAGALIHALGGGRVPFGFWAPDAVCYDGHEDIFSSEAFAQGECEMQDLSSQIVGLACAPQPGQTWWDACAGEGGKTLHLCDLMANRGLVWASDKADWRLERLKRRAARARLFNYRAASWSGGPKPATGAPCDGVLVDAPCSCLGTWHRDPWARWTTRAEDVAELAALQSDLLRHAAIAVRPGGRLVYAVCTVTRAETRAVCDAFEAACPGFEPAALGLGLPGGDQARLQIWQGEARGNGMFLAAWHRR